MQLVNVHNLKKVFGDKKLFEHVSFGIDSGQRVALVGPNGAGKSTLLKIVAGRTDYDDGKVSLKKGLKIGFLDQTPLFLPGATIMSAILEKCEDPNDGLADAYRLIALLQLNQFGEDFEVQKLSGGWRKRVALARELVLDPELLFLDEPTNHLDVESILWLEDFLIRANFATFMITHDRLFLQRVATRILDLSPRNPDYLLVCDGDYVQYLEQKELALSSQASQEQKLKNTLRRETEWLRRGAKARQTKQKARIQSASELAENVDDLEARNKKSLAQIQFGDMSKNPKRLIELINGTMRFGDKIIFENLDLHIGPKTRLGLLGENGIGKSTLIKNLLGLEPLSSGELKTADSLSFSYFEQARETLNPNLSVLKNICPEGSHVDFQGRTIHVRSYLDKFLFNGVQVDLPVAKLSGGEQARLRIAQLMLSKAQVLVLDEPTNDLDTDTLNVLEEALKDFNGAVILVTHDRFFMDSVCNQLLAFPPLNSPNKKLISFSSYLQWEAWYSSLSNVETANSTKTDSNIKKPKNKLTFKEKIELESMEKSILELEEKLSKLKVQSEDPSIMSNSVRLSDLFQEISSLQSVIDHKYERWSELENVRSNHSYFKYRYLF